MIYMRFIVNIRGFYNLLEMLRFDALAIGAMLAMMYDKARRSATMDNMLQTACRWYVQWPFFIVLMLAFQGLKFSVFHHTVTAFLFAMMLLNVLYKPKLAQFLDTPAWRWLGNLSYGAYCYNWITIWSAVLLVQAYILEKPDNIINFTVYVLSLLFTVLAAAISYECIERPCLRLKERLFTRVHNQEAVTILPERT